MFRVSEESVFTPFSGFRLFLGQPSEFPLLQSDHLLLAPGLGHSVRVSATFVSTDTRAVSPGVPLLLKQQLWIPETGTGQWPLSMTNLSPSKRGCRSTSFIEIKVQTENVGFPGRSKLLTSTIAIPGLVAGSTFLTEAQNALRILHCVAHSRFECAMKAAMKKLDCVPWYLPQKNGTKPCRCKSICCIKSINVYVQAPLRLPNSRMRWPWSRGLLVDAFQIVRIPTTSTP